MKGDTGNAITVRFALPREELRPYVTTYYLIEAQSALAGPAIEDHLHPEWANLRFLRDYWSQSAIGDEPLRGSPAFAVTGPTSQATRFKITQTPDSRKGGNWGIGLMPLGWAKFFDAPADEYADRFVDGNADPAFEALRELGAQLSQRFHGEPGDFEREVA